MKWKNEKRKVSDLKPAGYNPRKLSQESEKQLTSSIEKFDLCDPIVINKNDVVIGGHQRLKILKKQGVKDVDVRVPDVELTVEQEKELNLRLNKNLGEWDFDLLAGFDKDLLGDVGFDDSEFDLIFAKEIEPNEQDDVIPEVTESICKPGDLWQLGRHRVLCGDSTNVDDVERLMDGKKADMAHNDPPYGMKKEKEGVLNDNLNFDKLLQFNKDWISLQFTYLKDNGSWYCWGIDEPLMDIYSEIIKPYIKTQKATFRNLITWNKSYLKNGGIFNPFGASGMDGNRMYPIADEKCLFIMCGVQGFNNNADNYFKGWDPIRDYLLKSRLEMGWDVPTMKKIVGHSDLNRDHWTSKSQFNMPTREVYEKMKAQADRLRSENNNDAFKKEYDELKKEYDELKKEYYSTRAYFDNVDESNNVWNIELLKNGKEKDESCGHATPKPLALCERAIKSSCPPNGLVIDYFLGSGSTLIACEKTNRICYGLEIDPKHCDTIIKRWEDYTNGKAIKL